MCSPVAVLELLRTLIACRTENPPGDEWIAARYVEETLARWDVPVRTFEPEPGRTSLVARLRGSGEAGGALALIGHLDVVPVADQRWRVDPFGGVVEDGWVIGRGAADMKFMVAAELQIMIDWARRASDLGVAPGGVVPGLRRDLLLVLTADEEKGGGKGLGWLAAEHPDLIEAEVAVNELGAFAVPFAGRTYYPIQVGEKGRFDLRVLVRGQGGHAAMPSEDNALLLAAGLAQRLAPPGDLGPASTTAASLAEEFGSTRWGSALRELLDGRGARAQAWSRDSVVRAIQASTRDTFCPTLIRAGVVSNQIPSEAEVVFDCRILPGRTIEEAVASAKLRAGPIAESCSWEVGRSSPPLEHDRLHPILAHMHAALERHDPGAVPLAVVMPFSTDARHLAPLGIPTYGFSPLHASDKLRFLEQLHAPDERLPVSAVEFCYATLSSLVDTYAGSTS